MVKLYTKRVETCRDCPNFKYGGWCNPLRREMEAPPQAPPADCPLPDEPAPEVQP